MAKSPDFSGMTLSAPSAAFAEMMGANKRDIQQLPIEQLLPYPNQPFRPYTSDKLVELAEDIKQNGILSPVIIRTLAGAYQILSGHNRVAAAKIVGLATVPCIIKEVDDNQALLILVNTNLNQRQELLPSEKAFAYKMQLEATKQQGKRTDLTSGQIVPKLSAEVIGEQHGENYKQIQRYIRLTNLIKPLLDLVDAGTLPMIAGVDLSYLSNEQQEFVYDFVTSEEKRISLKQSAMIKQLAAGDKLDDDTLYNLFYKPSAPAKHIKLSTARITKYIPSHFTAESQKEDYIIQALEFYHKHKN